MVAIQAFLLFLGMILNMFEIGFSELSLSTLLISSEPILITNLATPSGLISGNVGCDFSTSSFPSSNYQFVDTNPLHDVSWETYSSSSSLELIENRTLHSVVQSLVYIRRREVQDQCGSWPHFPSRPTEQGRPEFESSLSILGMVSHDMINVFTDMLTAPSLPDGAGENAAIFKNSFDEFLTLVSAFLASKTHNFRAQDRHVYHLRGMPMPRMHKSTKMPCTTLRAGKSRAWKLVSCRNRGLGMHVFHAQNQSLQPLPPRVPNVRTVHSAALSSAIFEAVEHTVGTTFSGRLLYARRPHVLLRLLGPLHVGPDIPLTASRPWSDIPGFSTTDFNSWRKNFCIQLPYGLSDLITGDPPEEALVAPPGPGLNQAVRTVVAGNHAISKKRNTFLFQGLHASICKNVEATQARDIIMAHERDGVAAWKALCAFYNKPTLQNKLTATQQLLQIRQRPGESLSDYFSRARKIFSQVTSLEVTLPDLFAFMVMHGLGAQFEPLKTPMALQHGAGITIDEVYNQADQFEKRVSSQDESHASARMANGAAPDLAKQLLSLSSETGARAC